jgi:hypothetical protein
MASAIQDVVFKYAEGGIKLHDGAKRVLRTLRNGEGLEVSSDHSPLLRLAAILPTIAGNMENSKGWTPPEHNHIWHSAPGSTNVTAEEMMKLEK